MKTNKLAYLLTIKNKSKDNIDYIVLVDDIKELNTKQFIQFAKIIELICSGCQFYYQMILILNQ